MKPRLKNCILVIVLIGFFACLVGIGTLLLFNIPLYGYYPLENRVTRQFLDNPGNSFLANVYMVYSNQSTLRITELSNIDQDQVALYLAQRRAYLSHIQEKGNCSEIVFEERDYPLKHFIVRSGPNFDIESCSNGKIVQFISYCKQKELARFIEFPLGEGRTIESIFSDFEKGRCEKIESEFFAEKKMVLLNQLTVNMGILNHTKRGVIINRRNETYGRVNIFSNKAMDMQGRVRMEWDGMVIYLGNRTVISFWNESIYKYDSDKKVWQIRDFGHHEAVEKANGNILYASQKNEFYSGEDLIFDTIVEIYPNGSSVREFNTVRMVDELNRLYFGNRIDLPKKLRGLNPLDLFSKNYFHLNSIQELSRNALDDDERFRAGNILISLTNINVIAILDPDFKKILWSYGLFSLQTMHSPRMLENGNILIFDNGVGWHRSRVIELDPKKKEIVWEYSEPGFFAPAMGSAFRLPNNNTLITDSFKGRAFEVTMDKEIVWEYINPEYDEFGNIKPIYRMQAAPANFFE